MVSSAKLSASLGRVHSLPAHLYRPYAEPLCSTSSTELDDKRSLPSHSSLFSLSGLSSSDDEDSLPLPTISPTSSRSNLSLLPLYLAPRSASPALYLVLYLILNLTLTIHNKLVLAHSFPYPLTLTAAHCAAAAFGCRLLRQRRLYTPQKIHTTAQRVTVVFFSGLYAANVAVSNASLRGVSVPLHQTVRGITPLFTLVLAAGVLRGPGVGISRRKVLALLPLMVGVALASAGDYTCSATGFLLTLLGAGLAAAKTVATNALQSSPSTCSLSTSARSQPPLLSPTATDGYSEKPSAARKGFNTESVRSLPMRIHGISIHIWCPSPRVYFAQLQLWTRSWILAVTSRSKVEVPRLALHPLDLLARMSPIACMICLALAWMTGELAAVHSTILPSNFTAHSNTEMAYLSAEALAPAMSTLSLWRLCLLGATLAINAGIAFALNVVSFEANRRAGAVAMGVASNVKQALTVLVALAFFNSASGTGLGLILAGGALTLAGGAFYAHVERYESLRAQR